MKIALIGPTGMIGRRICQEALSRGHQVTGLCRDPSPLSPHDGLTLRQADATDAAVLQAALDGHEAVISAFGPSKGTSPSAVVELTRTLAAACMKSGVERALVVNGAGSLSVEPGVELLSTPGFPEADKPVALAHREALELWRRVKELKWTLISPAAQIEPGARTGRYRTGHNDLLVDERGRSQISAEDFAVAVVDELEHAAHIRERITFAY